MVSAGSGVLRRGVGAVRRRLPTSLRRLRREPLVSVIVPVYHVQDYVEECLRSVLEQTHRNLEVIVVDDGGTDGSMAVVREVCRGDRRVRIITQPNAGLGAARNTGVRAARGQFLRFVDSDDVLPPRSVEVLLASLLSSGSDFAVGNLRRLQHGRTWVPGWAKEVHRADRAGLVLDELPDVLKDPFAHNKLFRAEFFRRVVRDFPQGIRYEDQEPSTRAYVAGRFDVLRTVVYHWRVREDGTSITQQKSDPADLRDRLLVKDRVGAIMEAQASDAVFRAWAAKAIGFDLRSYYEQVPRTGDAFWQQLHEGVVRVARHLDEETWQRVPMIDRLLALATIEDHRSDVVALTTRREEYGWHVPGTVSEDWAVLDTGYLDGLELRPSPDQRRLAPADTSVRALVEAVRFDGGRLVVEGFAHLRCLDLTRLEQRLELALVGSESGERRLLTVVQGSSTTADLESGDAWNSFAASGFTATIDLDRWPHPDTEVWRLHVRVDAGPLSHETRLGSVDRRRDFATLPFGPAVAGKGRWTLVQDDVDGLGVAWVGLDPVRLVDAHVDGDDVRLVVSGGAPVTLELKPPDGEPLLLTPVGGSNREHEFVVRLPADDQTISWQVRAVSGGRRSRLFWPGPSTSLVQAYPECGRVQLRCSREGTLRLKQLPWTAVVDDVGLRSEGEAEVVLVSGRVSAAPAATWSLALTARTSTPDVAVDVAPDGTFSTPVPLVSAGGWPLVEGSLELTLTRREGDRTERARLNGATALRGVLPLRVETSRRAIVLDRGSQGALRLGPRRPYLPEERGSLAQRRLHALAATPGAPPAVTTVVFECFAGLRVADSPLALLVELQSRHPGWAFYWSVADLTTPAPEGCIPLLRQSRRWVEVVRSAQYLVNNANFPHWFRKHPHQTYVQTWHGTPLKKIGADMPRAGLSLAYRSLMTREPGYWDVLLAQSPWAGEVLARALGYAGPVLARGYPRDDALVDGETRRKEVRAELGLDDAQHVVLYAPTWRDDAPSERGRYALVSHLDLARATQVLGDVTFLLRGHSNTVVVERDDVLDVTNHPDVNDLLLAADALVTDYSSLMFDFCVTGKPIYFLVPDLEHYGSRTRGFYFDLLEAAPGPVCLTEDDLLTALAQRAGYAEQWAERYAAFVRRFAPFDDGRATGRVVDAVWGPGQALEPDHLAHVQHDAPTRPATTVDDEGVNA